MHRSMLFSLLMLTTAVRFIDIVYLLSRESINLPAIVIAVTSAMIFYGVVLIAKKLTGSLTMRQIMAFFLVQAGMIVLNMVYVAVFCPLRLNLTETFAVGSFLDILIDFCAVYLCVRHMRDEYRPFVKVIGGEQGHA